MTNQTITLAPGDTLTVVAGAAGSSTTPVPPVVNPPTPGPGPTPAPPPGNSGNAIDLHLGWKALGQWLKSGPIGPETPVRVLFRTGSVSTQKNNLPHITIVQTGGDAPPRVRTGVLSKAADGTVIDTKGPQRETLTFTFATGTGDPDIGWGMRVPVLELDTDYQILITSEAEDGGRCDMDIGISGTGNL